MSERKISIQTQKTFIMITIEIKNRRSMFLKNGKVWINGVEHTFRSRIAPDGIHVAFSDLPAGSYVVWVGVGRGKGGFRSKKIKVAYDGTPVNLRCSAGSLVMQLIGIVALFIPNSFYKLKRL